MDEYYKSTTYAKNPRIVVRSRCCHLGGINDAANAFKGVIPDDRWKEPYVSENELDEEIKAIWL